VKKQQNITGDIISAIAMCGLSVFVLHQTSTMSPESATFPRLLGIALAGFSGLFIILSLWNYMKSKRPQHEKIKSSSRPLWGSKGSLQEIYPFAITVFCIMFLIAYNRIGFELSAFGLVFAAMLLIQRKEALHKFYYAIIIPAVLVLIFRIGVGLRLPLVLEKFFQ